MYALVHTTNGYYVDEKAPKGSCVHTECVKLSAWSCRCPFNAWDEKRYTLILANGQRWSVPAEHCIIYWN